MLLSEGLRVASRSTLERGKAPSLAFVGAGGKTSAIFRLARELKISGSQHTVLVSTSTHFSQDQAQLADFHHWVRDAEDLKRSFGAIPSGIVLFTGQLDAQSKLTGLGPELLKNLSDFAQDHGFPLLIEADGARQRPLKAPAEHEPAIPSWVDTVVVVAGLDGLGRPLTSEYVHRPEQFAALSGLGLGEIISASELLTVLLHPQGGLKNTPFGARRIALLNGARIPEKAANAVRWVDHPGQPQANLLRSYEAVGLANISHYRKPDGSNDPVIAMFEQASGVILAAGGAQRMGQPKQLLNWHGEPLVRHTAKQALNGGLSPVIVVTGAFHDQVSQVLSDLPVKIAYNPVWETGQSSSLITGLKEIPGGIGSVVFLLADQPQIPVTLVRALVDLHTQTLSPIIAPQAGGRRANPVLFDRTTFADLFRLSGDMGGRALFSSYPITWIPWHDDSLLLDVDTMEDYARLLEL